MNYEGASREAEPDAAAADKIELNVNRKAKQLDSAQVKVKADL